MRRREQSDPLEENKLRALDAYLPISLVAFNRKGTASNGSGTLVSIGSDVVVATAGHVVRDLIAKHWVELRLLSDPVGASTDPAGFDEWQGACALGQYPWQEGKAQGTREATRRVTTSSGAAEAT